MERARLFRPASLALFMLTLSTSWADYCQYESNTFTCSGLTAASGDTVRSGLDEIPSASYHFSVEFRSCDFTGLAAEESDWFSGRPRVTSFACDACVVDTFPLPFFESMDSDLVKVTFSAGTIARFTVPKIVLPPAINTMNFSISNEDVLFDPFAFQKFSVMEIMQFQYVGHTPIQITESAFANITKLVYFYLDSDKIDEISSDAFDNLKKLTNLYLNNNALTVLDKGTFKIGSGKQPALKTLYLNGNPWDCDDCNLKWLQNFLGSVTYTDNPVCFSPPSENGTLISRAVIPSC